MSILECALRVASSAVRAAPAHRRYLIADAITAAVPWCAPRLFRRTRDNFATALGVDDSRARTLARQSIRNFGRMGVDFLWTNTLRQDQIIAVTTLCGDDHLWHALEARRGVILVLPHLGCWDVAAARASAAGLQMAIVTEGTWAARLAAGSRERPGISLVSRKQSLRALPHALQRNAAVVLLSDLARPGLATHDVPYFGRSAPLPSGAARLSSRAGAPIIVLACVRTAACRYRIDFRPALWPDNQSTFDLIAHIAIEFEHLVRAYPDQWYPFGQIWSDRRAPVQRRAPKKRS